MSYTAYILTDVVRAHLLSIFTPKHSDILCHHITESFGTHSVDYLPEPSLVIVIGQSFDESLECLVVEVNGKQFRPDGKRYHITLSLNRSVGRKPVDSNKVIIDSGIVLLKEPIHLGVMRCILI